MNHFQPAKIAIVGAGNVGSTLAYSLLMRGSAAQIVLIGQDAAKAEGEAMDLQLAVPFSHPAEIRAGSLQDVKGAAITIICAGLRMKAGLSAVDLLRHNAAVIREVVPEIAAINRDGVILIATEPVDALTYGAWRLSGLARNQVLGAGTLLDTARFRYLLGEHFQIDPRSVHAYILGEHGETALAAWSSATIAGMPITEMCKAHGCAPSALAEIFRQTRETAATLIERKGSSYYGIGAGFARVVESILRDEKRVFTVSSVLLGEYGLSNVAASVPTVVSGKGIDRILKLELDDHEVAQFLHSGRKVFEAIQEAGFELTSRLRAS